MSQAIFFQGTQMFPDAAGMPVSGINVGACQGTAFYPATVGTLLVAFKLPDTITLDTGLTFDLLMADDPLNARPGAKALFGVTAGPIVPGTSTFDDASETSPLAGSTEVTFTVTTPSAAGVLLVMTPTVMTDDLGSLEGGDWCMVRVRRLGTDVSDQHHGRIVLLGVDVSDAMP